MSQPTHFTEHGMAVRLDDVLLVLQDPGHGVLSYRVVLRDVADSFWVAEEVAVDLLAALRRHRG